jgi:hypothetical protein
MADRYFTYRYSGSRQQIGRSGRVYWFSYGNVTTVPYEEDAEWFLRMGSPESGVYYYRETDISGNPIGPFPPIDPRLRQSMVDTRRFPSDKGLPPAPVWRHTTETLGDPTLYYFYIRRRIRGPSRGGMQLLHREGGSGSPSG